MMEFQRIKSILNVLSLILLLSIPISGLALEIKDYSSEEFHSLAEQDAVIVLDFHAKWCSICKKQAKVLNKLANEGAYPNINVLRIDYDNSNELKQKYKIIKQSTLVLLQGHSEIDRVIAATNEFRIKMLLDEGVK